MKNTTKNITIIAEDIDTNTHGLKTRTTALDVIIDSSWPEKQIMSTLHDIAKEYCLIEDGRKPYDNNCNCFNIGDLALYVPTEIFTRHGIFPKFCTNPTDVISIDFDEQLVEKPDIFLEKEDK